MDPVRHFHLAHRKRLTLSPGGGMPQSGFLAMMADKTRDVETEDGVIEAFQVFDKDGKGM